VHPAGKTRITILYQQRMINDGIIAISNYNFQFHLQNSPQEDYFDNYMRRMIGKIRCFSLNDVATINSYCMAAITFLPVAIDLHLLSLTMGIQDKARLPARFKFKLTNGATMSTGMKMNARNITICHDDNP
jgi:hypothetical protein